MPFFPDRRHRARRRCSSLAQRRRLRRRLAAFLVAVLLSAIPDIAQATASPDPTDLAPVLGAMATGVVVSILAAAAIALVHRGLANLDARTGVAVQALLEPRLDHLIEAAADRLAATVGQHLPTHPARAQAVAAAAATLAAEGAPLIQALGLTPSDLVARIDRALGVPAAATSTPTTPSLTTPTLTTPAGAGGV